jgi:hypothetical protein
MYLKNDRTGSRTKEDLSQESTRENTRKESDSQKDVIFNYSNQQLCSLDYEIHPPHFKQ